MASLTSLASLGSVSCGSSVHFEGTFSLVHRVSLSRNIQSFRGSWIGKKWKYIGVCRCSVTTNFITEQGTSVSLDSTNDAEFVLRAAPKPASKPVSKPNLAINSENSDSIDEKLKDDEAERKKVIESLGEVLEKAEKLETSKKVNVTYNRPPQNLSVNPRNGKPLNAAVGQKSNASKSVWRKGNPVSSVQKVAKDLPKTENTQNQEIRPEVSRKLNPVQATAQPSLQAKPFVVPPPVLKKPVILKDVGASPKSPSPEGVVPVKSKERKPILIDKFAPKKSAADSQIAATVLAPTKPGKTPVAGKSKDEFRKKSGSFGGVRRRMMENEIPDEASELSVSISGTSMPRKGRKITKAYRKAIRLKAAQDAAPVKVEILEVGEEGMLIEELAYHLATSEGEIFGSLYSRGIKPDGVQTLDKDMVKMICKEYDVEVIDGIPTRVEEMAKKKAIVDEEDLDNLEDRPPILTIMGHVDHGKTSLLDYIRKSKVAASEAGGITQGIGAYKVLVPIDGNLQPCVFLDTPGHEAFGAMRARGTRVTDIAIIVVAADDGIRPQTKEAIAHAKAADVPIIIAINKIDKDGANPDRVMQELASIDLMPEVWGGDVPVVQISALKGQNIDELLETVMLVAEMQELKGNPQRMAKGAVIEAGLHKSKGPLATFIVQNGTLKKGDVVVCGEAFGKVRALFDDGGNRVDEAGPSIPVQVIGLNNVPIAGDEFEVVDSLDVARERAEVREESLRIERISAKAGDGKVTLSSLASAVSGRKLSGLDLHQLTIIMKVDLQGSIEALRQALQVLPQENVTLKFLLQATGDINNSDVDLAVASEAIILGFNVKTPASVKSYADNKGVEIRLYRVIYDLIDDVRTAMEGLLESVEEQIPIASAQVRALFSSGSGQIAGCMVTEGRIVKDCGIRVIRKGKTVHVGTLNSLKRVKEIVKEVSAGLECGIGVDDYDDWVVGDVIEAFNRVQKKRTLEEASATMTAAHEGAGIIPS
ncbi:translation initiation factor IF-2, chloroplastic-like [Impatiens glandulifera]|uniref:translation initiation factor IF-2, chloroplastic-like n=1 Tax=Impatiens glandulifera TaxID=253017 RepID=UPI001FB15280|nr:translation initiation factor IF-2, chloroplastic-like [Impatiens glandulifera]